MPFDFEDGYQEEQETPSTAPVNRRAMQEVQEQMEQPVDSELDAQMSEVERRLEKAQYYRILMSQDLFSVDSDIGAEVQREIRAFVREQMSILVGASSARTQSGPQFSEEETQILKEVARKLKKHPLKESSSPAVQPAPVPAAPALKPATPPSPPKQKTKPVARTPAPPPIAKKANPSSKPAKTASSKTITIIESDGTEVVYQKKVDPDRGEYYTDGTGRKFVLAVNSKGEQYMRTVDTQAAPVNVAPLPRVPDSQFSAISTAHATQTLESINKNPLLAAALTQSLKT